MRKMMCLCGLAGPLCAASIVHGAILIDDFDTFQTTTANGATPSDFDALVAAGILGSERELQADWTSGSNDVNLVSDAGGSSVLNYSTGAGTFGRGMVIWDGPDGSSALDPTGLGGVDLTDGGSALGLVINVEFDDLPASLDFTIYTDAGNSSTGSIALPGGIFLNQLFFLPFNAFVTQSGTGADFTNVGAIVMDITTRFGATDLQMEFIQADIPTPGAMALAGIGGAVVLIRRKQR